MRKHPVPAIGDTFGKLTVIGAPVLDRNKLRIPVRCECGTEYAPMHSNLIAGTKACRQCGCGRAGFGNPAWHTDRGHTLARDRVGQTFGRLTIVELLERVATSYRVRCVCSCGKEHISLLSNITAGATRSCGCLLDEWRHSDAFRDAIKTHGLSKRPEYQTWCGMMDRCENPKCRQWGRYGGRGITVCAGWHDVATFVRDMGDKPSAAHSIDRVDNDGGYWCGKCEECRRLNRPFNCRWATASEQGRNNSRTLMLEYMGVMVPVADLRERFGIHRQTYNMRVNFYGWDPVRAATTPPMQTHDEKTRRKMSRIKRGKQAPAPKYVPINPRPEGAARVVIGCEAIRLDDVACRAGVTRSCIHGRIERGLVGADLIAPKHAAPRKPWTRRVETSAPAANTTIAEAG